MVLTDKDKSIIKTSSVGFAIRTIKSLNLYQDTQENTNKLVNVITIKYYNWIVERALSTNNSISAQSSINRALEFSENDIVKYNDITDVFKKAELLYKWFIEN